MLRYEVIESQNGSLFIIHSKKDNLYGLDFSTKEIEEMDFDDDFLQEKVVEMAIAKFSNNDAQCIKTVIETCHKLYLDTLASKFSDKIIFITTQSASKSALVENLIAMNTNPDLVHLKIADINGNTFYFIFNETEISTMSVINALVSYFQKEYNINLNFNL